MAKMQRPCWTIAFGIICVLVVPGAVLTHMSVIELIPNIEDLPGNIVKGFDEVFKFAYLTQDSTNVKTASAGVVNSCGFSNAAVTCPNFKVNTITQGQIVQTGAAKTAIQKAFTSSLSIVSRIANDKYLGTADLQATAKKLNKITADLNKIKPSMRCYEAIPTFCSIYTSADGIVGGIAEVDKAINSFKTSDAVTMFEDNKQLLIVLHALPYFLVLSLIFFGCFWWKGGVCCCCRGGTTCGTLALLPSILLWIASFVIYLVVMVVGLGIKYAAHKIEVPVLNGKPTLDVAIAHIQTNYPKFWNVVFADMVDGLDLLLLASFFFVAACLFQSFYSSLEICCCPYRKKAEPKAAADAQSPAPGLLNPATAPAEVKPDAEQPAQKPEGEAAPEEQHAEV